jgi:ferritin-like metal-binding protein YciE
MTLTIKPSPDKVDYKQLFIHQLNRVNCTKGYLARNLPLLAEMASFKNMRLAIQETHNDVLKQQKRIDEIYKLSGAKASDEGCEVVKAVIEEAYHFGNHTGKPKIVNDMDIILYVRLIENIELTSFRVLKLIHEFIGTDQVTQLLAECCDENIDNDKLFGLVAEEYLDQKKQGEKIPA